jgi:hypothetical protein
MWWSGGIASFTFLDLGTEVSGQLHTPAALFPGKSPGTHWIGGWVGPPSRYGRCREEKNLALPGIEVGPSSQ